MTSERFIQRSSPQPTEAVQLDGDPSAQGPSPLLEQSAQYGQVARDALEDCQRGAEAEQELARRRNRSGQ